MKRSNIIQTRLDRDLARKLREHVKLAKGANNVIGEAGVIRTLLREALAAREGQTLPFSDLGFREGWSSGFAAAQRGMQTALHATTKPDGAR